MLINNIDGAFGSTFGGAGTAYAVTEGVYRERQNTPSDLASSAHLFQRGRQENVNFQFFQLLTQSISIL